MMYWSSITVLVAAITVGLPLGINGQQSGWVPNQVNATMCAWKGLRAAQLKDTAYLDGGFLYWSPGLANGEVGPPENDANPLGVIYTLNFSIPFSSTTNTSLILKPITPNGVAVNNLKPNYYDGALLANDHEFTLYGGLLKNYQAYTPPDADAVLTYQASDYGLVKDSFHPGFLNDKLPEGLTRYVTYGGAASAPSENKAWYFGGYRSPLWGPVYQPSNNGSLNPTNVSNSFITLDLAVNQSKKWVNDTLPPGTPSRANPSLVWVPVGGQGILVALGGVANPNYNNPSQKSLNEGQSRVVSPGYMTNIDIYDVASGKWYQQPTIDAPPQLAMGCAVVAPARDSSSYNIYYYGGYDGLHEIEDFSDDVWVLSLPSFVWTRLYSGKPGHARAGHQCLKPYPDQMITVGGYRSPKGTRPCLEGGILQVFNLTEGKWLDSYDPAIWNVYGVPEMIHEKIGGDYAGGATMTTPVPTGWATPALASVFATTYPASKITTYFPYSSESPGDETRGTWDNGDGGGGTPSWVAPVLGVVLGLVFITAIGVAIMLYRKRGIFAKRNSGSDHPGDERHHYIRVWLNNTGKAQTITTEEPSSRYFDMTSRNVTPMPVGYSAQSPIPEMTQHEMHHEMPGNHHLRFELFGDTSQLKPGMSQPIGELSAASPHSDSRHSEPKSPSYFTGSVSQEQPSSLNSSQVGINPTTAAAALAQARARERPDSPLEHPSPPKRTPMHTPPPNRDAVVSDMSRISDHHLSHISHLSHLRNLSNTSGATVSSASNTAPSPPTTPPATQTGFNPGPVSPPLPSPPSATTDAVVEAGDYMSVYQSMGSAAGPSRGLGASNSLRTSIFRENSDDLGDSPSRAHNTR